MSKIQSTYNNLKAIADYLPGGEFVELEDGTFAINIHSDKPEEFPSVENEHLTPELKETVDRIMKDKAID